MKTHVLLGLVFACVVAADNAVDNIQPGGYAITEQDLVYFSKGDGMWVYDDDDKLVKVTEDNTHIESEGETRSELRNRVYFYLYNKDHPVDGVQFYLNDVLSLKQAGFDPRKPTKIVTHGWINSRRSPACKLVRDAYVKNGDYNVIVIDWSKISLNPYLFASSRVQMVGEFVGTMIDFLQSQGLQMKDTTLVGHSLGAHVVGIAGHNANGKAKYIVGLDPAQPGFLLAGVGSRISRGDADYVEIIHTNAGLLGFLTAIGDSDFYPNGGSWQMGCLIDLGGACSHARSYRFFAESINSPVGFHGRHCKNYLHYILGWCHHEATYVMGDQKKDLVAEGNYFLMTRGIAPFAKRL